MTDRPRGGRTAPAGEDVAAGRWEYVVLSDVHLTEVVEPPRDGWWEYKSPEAVQDDAIVSFLESLQAQRPEGFDGTWVLFDGDTWDFDSVYSAPDGIEVGREGMPSTVPGAVYKMRRMLRDHGPVGAALSRFLAAGNRVTFVMGNHDRELTFPEVQEAMRQHLVAIAPPGQSRGVAERLSFEPWFVYVPGVLYVEHGQQYDTTCAYRDVLKPLIAADRNHEVELDMSFGSLTARRLLSRLGTFNPFNDESFILSLGGYMKHFFTYYWPKHKLFRPYLASSFVTMLVTRRLRRRALANAEDTSDLYRHYARRKGVGDGFIGLLRRLSSTPISERIMLLAHELWLDRWGIVLAAMVIFVVGLFNVETWTQGLLLLLLLPILTVVVRFLGRGSLALQERSRWGLVAEQISEYLRVPIVAFGHSHRPERRPLAGGGRYYNLGTWAPVLEADKDTTLARARRFLIVRPSEAGRVHVVFQRWADGEIKPY